MRKELARFATKRPAEARTRPESRPGFVGVAIGSRFFAEHV